MKTFSETYGMAPDQLNRTDFASPESTRAGRSGQYFMLLLFGMFVILLLMGLWMGTVAFRAINTMQNTTDDARLALNSLQNRVRSFDEQGSFGTAEGPEGPAMVFTYKLDAGNYETRLYLYEGELVQELAFSTDPYLPMTATKVVETNTFSFTYENGLLTVTTDQGSACVALRSEANLFASTGNSAENGNGKAMGTAEGGEARAAQLLSVASFGGAALTPASEEAQCAFPRGEVRAAQLLNVTPSEDALRPDLRNFSPGGVRWTA